MYTLMKIDSINTEYLLFDIIGCVIFFVIWIIWDYFMGAGTLKINKCVFDTKMCSRTNGGKWYIGNFPS